MLRLLLVAVLVGAAFTQTTPNIQLIFLGKCYERAGPTYNCTALWNAFAAAATIPNNIVNTSNYVPFFQLASFTSPPSNALFWSGNQPLSDALGGGNSRYTTLEQTNTGFILNGLSWCGLPGAIPPAFDYSDQCVFASNFSYYGTQGVWTQCSALFATQAAGLVTVLLQPAPLNFGTAGSYMAYRNTSVFYNIELPSMNKTQITGVTVFLIKNTTLAPQEVCGSGSLVQLSHDVQAQLGIVPTCIDDPQVIRGIFCANNSKSETCVALNSLSPTGSSSSSNTSTLIWAAVLTAVAGVAIIAVVVLAVLYARSKSG
jgi:hypothetical protein